MVLRVEVQRLHAVLAVRAEVLLAVLELVQLPDETLSSGGVDRSDAERQRNLCRLKESFSLTVQKNQHEIK